VAAADFRVRHVLANRIALSCGQRGRFARWETIASATDRDMKPPLFQAVAGALLIVGGATMMLAWCVQPPWLKRFSPNSVMTVFDALPPELTK